MLILPNLRKSVFSAVEGPEVGFRNDESFVGQLEICKFRIVPELQRKMVINYDSSMRLPFVKVPKVINIFSLVSNVAIIINREPCAFRNRGNELAIYMIAFGHDHASRCEHNRICAPTGFWGLSDEGPISRVADGDGVDGNTSRKRVMVDFGAGLDDSPGLQSDRRLLPVSRGR